MWMRFKYNIEKKAIDNFDYASSGQAQLFHVIVSAFFDIFFPPPQVPVKIGLLAAFVCPRCGKRDALG